MKYLCLIYEDETLWEKMPKAEMDQIYGEYFAFTDAIKKSGHHLGGNPLQPTQTATTVRVRNGRVSTTDGPFAETKEQLGVPDAGTHTGATHRPRQVEDS